MRLRNRIVKATMYTDPDLCRWPRDKRDFYRSLWAVAEDSCCLEDDMFGVKLAAWPSPLDADLTVELFDQWRDELIAEKKLIRYEVNAQLYLYIPTMAEHEKPRNPQSPDVPLPPWVKWVPSAKKGNNGRYEHDTNLVAEWLAVDTTSPVLSCPDLSCPDLSKDNLSLDGIDISVLGYWEGKVGREARADELKSLRSLCRHYEPGVINTAIGQAVIQGSPPTNFALITTIAKSEARH